MKYVVKLKPSAEKALNKLDKEKQTKIKRVLYELSMDPYIGKKLKGDLGGEYTVRAWPYRVIYRIYKNELIVFIIKIGHRQGVY